MRRLRLISNIKAKHGISSSIDNMIFEMSKVKSFFDNFWKLSKVTVMSHKGQSSLMSNYCYEKSRKDSYLKLNKSRLVGACRYWNSIFDVFAHKNLIIREES